MSNQRHSKKHHNDNKCQFNDKDKSKVSFSSSIQEKKPTKCIYSSKCGGCKYIDISYDEQLLLKQQYVERLLEKYGPVHDIIGMNDSDIEPLYYRNKVHHVIDRDRKNNIISGFYRERSHDLIPVKECLIEDRKSQEIINTVCDLAKSFKIKTYNEDNGTGLFRHVLVRSGFKTGEIMVVLVLASHIFPSKNNFIKALITAHPEISTIVLNVNTRNDNMVLGDRNDTLYGKGFIEDELCGLKFRISPSSFYQINPVQTEKLYSLAVDLANSSSAIKNKKMTIIDAYCGIGTIGLYAASRFSNASVIGVELNGNAVKDAKINSKINNLSNVEFFKADAGCFMEKMSSMNKKVDIVFMDPPRAGSTQSFINSIVYLKPSVVVYISCNPETQARDLDLFLNGGYSVDAIQPVDMFPYTEHVETVVLMSRSK